LNYNSNILKTFFLDDVVPNFDFLCRRINEVEINNINNNN